MKKVIWLLVLITIGLTIIIGLLDVYNFDDFLYQFFKFHPLIYYDLPIWQFFQAVGTLITAVVTAMALWWTYRAGLFEKTPDVLASGTFIISTKNATTNKKRDYAIEKEKSIHTLQLINVGRGLAKNVVPSREKKPVGEFLEDVSPHSFVIPPGKSTKDLGEILRVHGQIFIPEKRKLNFEGENKAFFYINFEGPDKSYLTEVKVQKVTAADGNIGRLITIPGIEIWKVVKNTKKTLE